MQQQQRRPHATGAATDRHITEGRVKRAKPWKESVGNFNISQHLDDSFPVHAGWPLAYPRMTTHDASHIPADSRLSSQEDHMPLSLTTRFVALSQISAPKQTKGAKTASVPTVLVVFAGKDGSYSEASQKLLGAAAEAVARAAKANKFKGNAGSSLDILAPAGLTYDRLLVVGTARKPADNRTNCGWTASVAIQATNPIT